MVISLRMEPLSFKLVNILAKSAPQFEDVSIIINFNEVMIIFSNACNTLTATLALW